MRLSLVDDYDDRDEGSSPSQDSVSLDIAPKMQKQTASYTNLFDTSQPNPVGATYQQTKSGSPHHIRPKDIHYDRSPRPMPVTRLTSNKPPLAIAEDFSPTESSKPKPAPRTGRPHPSKPPIGQMRSVDIPNQGQSAMYSSKNNGYPARSSSEELFREAERSQNHSNYPSRGYNQYPDGVTRRSTEYLDQRGRQYNQQGNSRTLPNQNRYGNNTAANHNAAGNDEVDEGDYKRPMSFVKALEMSEVMQKAREKDRQEQLKNEEKKKSVYDSAYEISV